MNSFFLLLMLLSRIVYCDTRDSGTTHAAPPVQTRPGIIAHRATDIAKRDIVPFSTNISLPPPAATTISIAVNPVTLLPSTLMSILSPSTTPSPTSTPLTSTPTSSPCPHPAWTSTPTNGSFSTRGFGDRTQPHGTGVTFVGNVGDPWGSNIIPVSATDAWKYKYVVQFSGHHTEPWQIIIWNKIGPDGRMTGWYGYSALDFTLYPGEVKYVAFDENSQGGWGAAPAPSIPLDDYGGYASTWGEFDFGDSNNDAWSGWDVSAIQAQEAGLPVQGMKICQLGWMQCSIITGGAERVVEAFTASNKEDDGRGGLTPAGPVRLTAQIDYRG